MKRLLATHLHPTESENCQRISLRLERAPSNTKSIRSMELMPDVAGVDVARKESPIERTRRRSQLKGFIQHFDSIPRHMPGEQLTGQYRAALRRRVEECVPAGHIRLQRVLGANTISELDLMPITWTTAVGFVCAG